MSRSAILFAVIAVVTGAAPGWLPGPNNSARGESSTTGNVSTAPVLQDNFDTNQRGPLWRTYGETEQMKVMQINKRLEFVTSWNVSDGSVGYIGDRWWIDPTEDFQMKLDLYFDGSTGGAGWVSFGLTPDPNGPKDRYARIGIGSSHRAKNYWWEWKDGWGIFPSFTGRYIDRVTVYISYDASNDVLYVSDSGYGPDRAWKRLEDCVGGLWNRRPLFVFLGASTRNMTLDGGNAYADNFVVEKGKIGSAKPAPPTGPTDPGQPGVEPGGPVPATVWMMPSVIRRTGSGDIKAVVSLPTGIRITNWDPADIPVISPGNIPILNPQAAVWPGGTVMIVGSLSRTALLQAVPTNGPVELRLTGLLKDGRFYDGTCTVIIE